MCTALTLSYGTGQQNLRNTVGKQTYCIIFALFFCCKFCCRLYCNWVFSWIERLYLLNSEMNGNWQQSHKWSHWVKTGSRTWRHMVSDKYCFVRKESSKRLPNVALYIHLLTFIISNRYHRRLQPERAKRANFMDFCHPCIEFSCTITTYRFNVFQRFSIYSATTTTTTTFS